MKSRLERIIEKLPNQEVELSAQKVELSLVSDLNTAYNALLKIKDKMDDDLSKAKKSAVMGDSGINNFNKLYKNVEEAAKSLGTSVKDLNLQKLVNEIKSMEDDFNKVINA
tara:strand:+ start:167 stop:499 length:333 start_codon:yes stop_codon:yes gene_type:complete